MFLLVILFIAVPLVELYVIIQVGQWIGAGPTIALLLLDSILGAALLRHQGRAAWRRFNLALNEGRVPHRETFDGAMVIFGGALLLTPGFLSDIAGLLFLLPPTRALIRRVFLREAMRRMTVTMATSRGPGFAPPRDGDVEGSAVEIDRRPGLGR
jgi:UPF0716 protein FxsA